jgi:hypothetical protein
MDRLVVKVAQLLDMTSDNYEDLSAGEIADIKTAVLNFSVVLDGPTERGLSKLYGARVYARTVRT